MCIQQKEIAMTIESVRRIVSDIPAGRFFRIAYKTQVPIKKEYKDEITILKITEMTTRTGVSYASVANTHKELIESNKTTSRSNGPILKSAIFIFT